MDRDILVLVVVYVPYEDGNLQAMERIIMMADILEVGGVLTNIICWRA